MENTLPALRDPDMTPQKAINSLPHIGADAYAHVGKFAGAIVIAAFHQLGGMERFVNWADDNYSDYATKLLGKTIQKSAQVDHSHTVTIDDAISRLESRPIPLEAEFTEVWREPEYDL